MTAPDLYNPYNAPPAAPAGRAENEGKRLATRAERFLAALLDGFFNFVVGTLLAVIGVALHLDPSTPDPFFAQLGITAPSPVLSEITSLVPLFVQWSLIASSGQSLGKKIVGLRIALADGRSAGALHGVVLRAVPLHVIALIPVASHLASGPGSLSTMLASLFVGAVVLADLIPMFDSSYRCVHDRIAGTFVVSLRP